MRNWKNKNRQKERLELTCSESPNIAGGCRFVERERECVCREELAASERQKGRGFLNKGQLHPVRWKITSHPI